jgi:CheY-like chemotaxis protein
LKELLTEDGQNVVVTGSGAEAVQLARSFAPHMVLCNLELAGSMSG